MGGVEPEFLILKRGVVGVSSIFAIRPRIFATMNAPMWRSGARSVSASPIGGLLRSQPSYFFGPVRIGMPRKRWTRR
jgi:hypothetical protein